MFICGFRSTENQRVFRMPVCQNTNTGSATIHEFPSSGLSINMTFAIPKMAITLLLEVPKQVLEYVGAKVFLL